MAIWPLAHGDSPVEIGTGNGRSFYLYTDGVRRFELTPAGVLKPVGSDGQLGQIAINTTVSLNRLFTIGGSFSGNTATQAFSVNPTLSPLPNTDAYGGAYDATFVEAASGTHALLAQLALFNNPVVAGGATVTNTALLYLEGPLDAVTTGSNYSLWVDEGPTRLDGVVTVSGDTATPAGGSTSARLLFGTTAGFGIYYGSGAPTVSAAQGSLYLRSDGSSTSTRAYINTDGGTTWTNITTAA